MPSYQARMEYLRAIYARYHKATRQEKGQILEEFCKVCHYNRKYAIGLLNAPPPEPGKRMHRRRPFLYSQRAVSILQAIWEASGHLCSQRLKEALPLWLPSARKRFGMTPDTERELLSISSRQIENRLRSRKRILKKRTYGATRPGPLLKSMIPIRTSHWDIRLPGFLEMDTVAHCGRSLSGGFLWTLNATDIQTGWTERVAVMGKGQAGVFDGILEIKHALPFRLRGVDSDNGEEFINYHLLSFCLKSRPRMEFTRGRENKKNDNCHVEQKNYIHVRQILGWDRYDTVEAQKAINSLYENELGLFQNLFQPSVKLIEKKRIGSKVKRLYDKSKTPFQRVWESGKYHKAKVKRLKEQMESIDPFELSQAIDRKLGHIYKMASGRIQAPKDPRGQKRQDLECPGTNENGSRHVPAPPASHPWRHWCFSRKGMRLEKIMRRKIEEAIARG